MENLEVILVNFNKSDLDKLIDEFKISSSQVKRSHFFDRSRAEDIEFHQIKSLKDILTPNGTGNIFLSQLEMGYIINDVMILFSFDEEYGDIVFNFPESELFTGENAEIKSNAKKIIEFFLEIKERYGILNVRVGLEPASDDDTCLLELKEQIIDLDDIVENMLK